MRRDKYAEALLADMRAEATGFRSPGGLIDFRPDECPYNPAGPCDCEVEETFMPGFAEPVRRDHVRRADYAQTNEPPRDIPVDRTSWYASRMPPSKVTPFKPTSLIDWARDRNTR